MKNPIQRGVGQLSPTNQSQVMKVFPEGVVLFFWKLKFINWKQIRINFSLQSKSFQPQESTKKYSFENNNYKDISQYLQVEHFHCLLKSFKYKYCSKPWTYPI